LLIHLVKLSDFLKLSFRISDKLDDLVFKKGWLMAASPYPLFCAKLFSIAESPVALED
jgi:hypothetical protein